MCFLEGAAADTFSSHPQHIHCLACPTIKYSQAGQSLYFVGFIGSPVGSTNKSQISHKQVTNKSQTSHKEFGCKCEASWGVTSRAETSHKQATNKPQTSHKQVASHNHSQITDIHGCESCRRVKMWSTTTTTSTPSKPLALICNLGAFGALPSFLPEPKGLALGALGS